MEEKEAHFHSQVEKGVQALLQVIEKKKESTKQPLLDEDHLVNLQFSLKKVPKEQKIIKLKLPNGLVEEHKDVCLFVKDLDRTDREYEKSIRHFKALLKSKGISFVSEIIPLKALKLEYKPFEAKRNLANRFDVFLADARIIRRLPAHLGKAFYGRKKIPNQVRMDVKDLKSEFESAISNSRCIFAGKGPVGLAFVGSTRMSVAEIVQNVASVVDQLVAAVPGGTENIRSIHIKTPDSMAIPVYASLGSANKITLPPTTKQRIPAVVGEVSTVEDALVKVLPSGVVKLVDESGNLIQHPKLKRKKAIKRAGRRGAKPIVEKAKQKRTIKAKKIKVTGKKQKTVVTKQKYHRKTKTK